MLRVLAVEEDAGQPYSFTPDEKSQYYEAREILKSLPPTGKDGGMMQRIASLHNVTRQYVHQVLFPKSPDRLFMGRSGTYRSIWAALLDETDRHQSAPLYREFSRELTEKNFVEAQIPKSRIRFIKRRASAIAKEYGKTLTITGNVTTIPTTYKFILS